MTLNVNYPFAAKAFEGPLENSRHYVTISLQMNNLLNTSLTTYEIYMSIPELPPEGIGYEGNPSPAEIA